MKSPLKYLILLTLVAAGCATDSAGTPPHMGRVKVLQFDTAVRPTNPKFEFFNAPPEGRHYKVVALITCEGAYHEEVVMTQAIIYKAKQLGADAAINLDPDRATTGNSSQYGGSVGGRRLFRANAIVFDK